MKTIRPIATIYTDFNEKFGLPRQSGRVEELCGKIVFEPTYRSAEALRGIEQFSHLWLIFGFSAIEEEPFRPTVRPPKLGGNQRVGVFASRSPFRPNGLGLSCVRLLSVQPTENEGIVLLVSGVDMLNRTPIYDIKPYIPHADCRQDAVGGFSDEHRSDRLQVECNPDLLEVIPREKRSALLGCLAEDPRPAYQDDGRVYGMSYAGFNISFVVHGQILTVQKIEKCK
jgi:tRNA-Thr(GGU) m(6)t(6)A37 methyltransferase TsaA